MKIRSIKIENIGGIRDLTIDFDDHMNFICGPNGVGKTTILECIAHSFSAYQTHILKKYANAECGKVIVVIDNNGSTITSSIGIDEFEPDKNSQIAGIKEHSIKLLSLKVTRTFQYQQLASVGRDAKKDSHLILDEAKSGLNLTEVKGWFVNRYLYSKHDDSLRKSQLYNFELAKRCFSLLNPDFSFKKILASTNEIIINSPSGEIYYEYLSSGFKSCLSILFGIIKDVEYRFEQPGMNADDFDGIILIDELELHLHPEWQSKIAKILNKTFPSAQFITSTHSPHIIQSANSKLIITMCIGAQSADMNTDFKDGQLKRS